MNTITKYLLYFFLIGCGGREPVSLPTIQPALACSIDVAVGAVDGGLTPYVEEFFSNAHKHGLLTCSRVKSVTFSEDLVQSTTKGLTTVGECNPDSSVRISSSYWEFAAEYSRKTLVHHEMGHCALHLDHAPKDSLNIMAPSVLDPDLAEANWDALLDKLFTRNLTLTDP